MASAAALWWTSSFSEDELQYDTLGQRGAQNKRGSNVAKHFLVRERYVFVRAATFRRVCRRLATPM